MSRSLVGAWKLVTWERRSPNGDISYPYGEDVAGHLLYTDDGYMSASLMDNRRSNMSTDDLRAASVAEKAAASDTHLSYSGRYELHDGRVVHYPEVASFPNWVGRTLERFIELDGDTLSISTPPRLIDGVESRAFLVWTRP